MRRIDDLWQQLDRTELDGGVTVSTVRLADLWETMVLDGPHDGYIRRYKDRHRALVGHQEVVRWLADE